MTESTTTFDVPGDKDACLTKRELLAAMAMQGILANRWMESHPRYLIAESAVHHADALLRELQCTVQQRARDRAYSAAKRKAVG